MKKNGYSENTIKPLGRRLKALAKKVNLNDTNAVKEYIAKSNFTNGYKENLVNAYNQHAVFYNLQWNKPKYQRAYNIKKLPLESNIDARA